MYPYLMYFIIDFFFVILMFLYSASEMYYRFQWLTQGPNVAWTSMALEKKQTDASFHPQPIFTVWSQWS